jgi:hypothetical protein
MTLMTSMYMTGYRLIVPIDSTFGAHQGHTRFRHTISIVIIDPHFALINIWQILIYGLINNCQITTLVVRIHLFMLTAKFLVLIHHLGRS